MYQHRPQGLPQGQALLSATGHRPQGLSQGQALLSATGHRVVQPTFWSIMAP
jgi:hypothetical protein